MSLVATRGSAVWTLRTEMTSLPSLTLAYPSVKSRDPKWQRVRPGQYAVVRLEGLDNIVLLFSAEDSLRQAVAYARSLGMPTTRILFRDGEQRVEVFPWR
jgi:hypothetical protein